MILRLEKLCEIITRLMYLIIHFRTELLLPSLKRVDLKLLNQRVKRLYQQQISTTMTQQEA